MFWTGMSARWVIPRPSFVSWGKPVSFFRTEISTEALTEDGCHCVSTDAELVVMLGHPGTVLVCIYDDDRCSPS